MTEINGTAASIAFNGETFVMPGSLSIPLTVAAGGAGKTEFAAMREGMPIRNAIWD